MPKLWLNLKGQIISANDDWDRLAGKNESVHLSLKSITGRTYLSFIQGDAIRMLMETIFTRVNITGKPFIVHYRCDNKNHAQFVKMMVSKEDEATFCVEHQTENIADIFPELLFTEKAGAAEKRCGICGRVHFNGEWYDALTHRHVFGSLKTLQTESDICGSCSGELSQSLS